jgi:hypothetical protein
MRRAHRSVHRALWPVLALLVILALAAALWLRPQPGGSDQKSAIGTVPSDYWLRITDDWPS